MGPTLGLRKLNVMCIYAENRVITQVKRVVTADGYVRWCPDHKGKKNAIRMKLLVEKSHLTLAQFISATYFWSNEVIVKNTVEMTGLSERVVVNWYNFCREVCFVLADEEHKTNRRRGAHGPD